jgi:hypothetical protein
VAPVALDVFASVAVVDPGSDRWSMDPSNGERDILRALRPLSIARAMPPVVDQARWDDGVLIDTRFAAGHLRRRAEHIWHFAGWPWLSMSMCWLPVEKPGDPASFGRLDMRMPDWLLPKNPTNWDVPMVPIRPYWPNVLANSVVYGVVWAAIGAGLWRAWAWWRVLRERRRVLCATCRYDARGFAVCPECGTPTPHTAVTLDPAPTEARSASDGR